MRTHVVAGGVRGACVREQWSARARLPDVVLVDHVCSLVRQERLLSMCFLHVRRAALPWSQGDMCSVFVFLFRLRESQNYMWQRCGVDVETREPHEGSRAKWIILICAFDQRQ